MIACHSLISRPAFFPVPVATLLLSNERGGQKILCACGFQSCVLSRFISFRPGRWFSSRPFMLATVQRRASRLQIPFFEFLRSRAELA